MKSTGIVRCPDSLGRIVLPKELRSTFGIAANTPLEIFTDQDTILLRKYRPSGTCDLCGEYSAEAVMLHGKYICPACRKALAGL